MINLKGYQTVLFVRNNVKHTHINNFRMAPSHDDWWRQHYSSELNCRTAQKRKNAKCKKIKNKKNHLKGRSGNIKNDSCHRAPEGPQQVTEKKWSHFRAATVSVRGGVPKLAVFLKSEGIIMAKFPAFGASPRVQLSQKCQRVTRWPAQDID